eukprot:TRINITY_DN1221_c0_g1_i2.p1 TRINITY_DN1221_c0_g1~~TRINITY_DN1221_c0_g1_i2.p1  ORF type:complete len:3045 (-),score=601.73 TRINITY_DN1221_c0_g1_i2:105-9239(-)
MNWWSSVVERVRTPSSPNIQVNSADHRVVLKTSSLWADYESASQKEKLLKIRELLSTFIVAYKPNSSLDSFPDPTAFAVIVAKSFCEEVSKFPESSLYFDQIFTCIAKTSPTSLLHELTSALLVLVSHEACAHALVENKIFSVGVNLLRAMFENAVGEAQSEETKMKVGVVNSIVEILREGCFQPEALDDLVKSDTLSVLFITAINTVRTDPLAQLIKEGCVDILLSCSHVKFRKPVVDYLRHHECMKNWILAITSYTNFQPGHLISLCEVLVAFLRKSCETSSSILEEFSAAKGFKVIEKTIISVGTCSELPQSLPHLLESLAELVYVGPRDFTKVLSKMENFPHQKIDIQQMLQTHQKQEDIRIRNLEPFVTLEQIFLETSNMILRQKVLDCVFGIYACHPLNYFVLYASQPSTLPLFLQELDDLPDPLKLHILNILDYIVTNINAVPYKELYHLCVLIEKRVTTKTLYLVSDKAAAMIAFDSMYKDILSEVGMMDVLLQELGDFVNVMDKACREEINMQDGQLIHTIQQTTTSMLSWGSDGPSETEQPQGDLSKYTFEEYLIRFPSGVAFDITRYRACLNLLQILIQDHDGNLALFRKLKGLQMLTRLTPYEFSRREALKMIQLVIRTDEKQHHRELSELLEVAHMPAPGNVAWKIDILEAICSLISSSIALKTSFGIANGLDCLLSLQLSMENVVEKGEAHLTDAIALYRAIGRIYVCALSRHPRNRQLFHKQAEYGRLSRVLEMTGLVQSPFCPIILDIFFDIAMEWTSESARWKSIVIENPAAAICILEVLHRCSPALQLDTLQNIYRILSESTFNTNALSGTLEILLLRFPQGFKNEAHPLHQTLVRILSYIISYRVTPKELKLILRLIREPECSPNIKKELFIALEKSHGSSPFLEFDLRKSPVGSLTVTGFGERAWPPNSGFTLSFWLCVISDSEKGRIPLITIVSEDQRPLLQLSMENDRLTYLTSAKAVSNFEHEFKTNTWYHVAIVHLKSRFQASSVSLWVDAVPISNVKHSYPSGTTAGSQLIIGSSLMGLSLGTPQQHVTLSSHNGHWQLGTTYMFEDALQATSIVLIYLLGRSYFGHFLGDLRVFHTFERSGPKLETIDQLTSTTGISIDKILFRISAVHKETRISADGCTEYRSIANITSAYKTTKKAVLTGSAYAFHPCDIADGIRRVGGIATMIFLISQATTTDELNIALDLLVSAIRFNAKNTSEMHRIRGYEIVAHFLKQKANLADPLTLDVLLRLAGFDDGMDPIASNILAMKHLIFNFDIWLQTPAGIQMILLERVLLFFTGSDKVDYNIRRTRKLHIIQVLLDLLQNDGLQEILFTKVVRIINEIILHSLSKDELQTIANFLLNTLPACGFLPLALNTPVGSVPHRRSTLTKTQTETRGRKNSVLPAAPRLPESNPRATIIRNMVLECLWNHLQAKPQPVVLQMYSKVFGYQTFLCLMDLPPFLRACLASKTDGPVYAKSETTVIIALKILIYLLLKKPNFYAKFRNPSGFLNLGRLLSPYHYVAEIYHLLLCLAFNRPIRDSLPATLTLDNLRWLLVDRGSTSGGRTQDVALHSVDALNICLSMLKYRLSHPREVIRRTTSGGSATLTPTIGSYSRPSASDERPRSLTRSIDITTMVQEDIWKDDLACIFVAFLESLLSKMADFLEAAKRPEFLDAFAEILFVHVDDVVNIPTRSGGDYEPPSISSSYAPPSQIRDSELFASGTRRTWDFAETKKILSSPGIEEVIHPRDTNFDDEFESPPGYAPQSWQYSSNTSLSADSAFLSQAFRFLNELIHRSMQTSPKAIHVVESILESAPITNVRDYVPVYQSRVLQDLMVTVEKRLADRSSITPESGRIFIANVSKALHLIVDKCAQALIKLDPDHVLRFAMETVKFIEEDATAYRPVFASAFKNDPNLALAIKSLNRMVLNQLLDLKAPLETEANALLLNLTSNSKLIFTSNNNDTDFYVCLCAHVLQLWKDGSESVKVVMRKFMEELFNLKKPVIASLFVRNSSRNEQQNVITVVHLINTNLIDEFLDWCNDTKDHVRTVVDDCVLKPSKVLRDRERKYHADLQEQYHYRKETRSSRIERKAKTDNKILTTNQNDRRAILMDVQTKESAISRHKRLDKQDSESFAINAWEKVEESLMREHAVWGSETVSLRAVWYLDSAEGPHRIRKKLYPKYAKKSLPANLIQSPAMDPQRFSEPDKRSSGGQYALESVEYSLSEKGISEVSTDITAEEGYATEDEAITTNEDDTEIEEDIQPDNDEDLLEESGVWRMIDTDEIVEFKTNCQRVALMDTCRGIFVLGNKSAYFIENYEFAANGDLAEVTEETPEFEWARDGPQPEAKPKALRHDFIKWSYESLRDIQKRRYLLRQVALELFGQDGCSHMLVFNANERDDVYSRITSHLPQSTADMLFTPIFGTNDEFEDAPRLIGWKKSLTTKWQQGQLSNFQYLMHLNTMAGRTYNDLTQYPVFPWVIADYTSETLDLGDEKIYRDLTKPMGAITDRREEIARERFELWDDPNVPKFHYGSHYSSSGIVLYFLIRMEPFTQHHRDLQGGRFDHPDRLFHALQDAWRTSTENSLSDVKELIPEFYSSFEYLLNRASHEFGTKQTGQRIDQVVLPPWAKGDPRLFMRLMLQALESDYVSNNLHNWIDLIFGYKQSGKAAEDAVNLFYYLTYEGSVDIDSIQDPQQRKAIIAQINNFGQTPKQIFRRAHPKRLVMPSTLQFFPALNLLVPTVLKSLDSAVSNIALAGDKPIPLTNRKIGMPPSFSKCLAWGFTDFSVRILNIGDEKILSVAESFHDDQVSCLAMTDDGNTIVSGGYDSIVNVWRFKKRGLRPYDITLAQSLIGHSKPITCVAVSRTFSIIASGAEDGLCVVWCLNRLSYIRQIFVKSPVVSITINETNGDIVTCTASEIFSWSINGDLHGQGTIKNAPDDSFTSLAVTKDPEWTTNYYITGHRSGAIRFWNTFPMAVHENPVCASLITVRQLVCEETVLKAHDTPITALSATSEQRKFFSGDESGKVVCWSLPIDESQIIRF